MLHKQQQYCRDSGPQTWDVYLLVERVWHEVVWCVSDHPNDLVPYLSVNSPYVLAKMIKMLRELLNQIHKATILS